VDTEATPIPAPTADVGSPPPFSFTDDQTEDAIGSLGSLFAAALGGDAGSGLSNGRAEINAVGALKDDAESQLWEPFAALAALMSVAGLFAIVLGKP
jgi:hypothetical protein